MKGRVMRKKLSSPFFAKGDICMTIFRKKATKTLAAIVEDATEPIKQDILMVKDAAKNKTNILANGVKLLVCLVIGYMTLRDTDDGYSKRKNDSVPHIVINNYIDRRDKNGTEKPE